MPPEALPNAEAPVAPIPRHLRVAGLGLRALFIATLVVLTFRVSVPQNERLWSVYETPGDLIRVILGLAVGVWIVFHLFKMPEDEAGYRTWIYFGLAVVPFAIILAVAVW